MPSRVTKANQPKAPNPTAEVKLLSGGNPQIALGHGDETVQTYIAAMPGWKRTVGELLDRLITRAVPKVTKAVKWNTPLYGLDKATRFMGFNCTTNYVKVAFFMGAHLDPMPPDASTRKDVRYLHIRENDKLDEKQFTRWVKEAAKLPGVRM
ncbi:MAG: DUF1801 domain-containing protein [Flavobacteriales bacterium]|nr:DUF1801 domain-containing protein [Flavobacteriales bacterium]MEB2342888.1 DUF1801 domain-containing protein [Flavobacteriia bacterium]